jgi:hypothetical protein
MKPVKFKNKNIKPSSSQNKEKELAEDEEIEIQK